MRPPLTFACASLLLIVVLAGCGKRNTDSAGSSTSVIRISQRNEPADLDPATATLPDEFFIIRALSEGLVAPAADNSSPANIRPAAAERWDVSADGLVYTFHLRPNARWSNGEPLTAADFVESFRRALTPATAAPQAHLFFPVKNARAFATGAVNDFGDVGIRASDARTLAITLEHPTPRFLAYVASGPWIPVNVRVVAQRGRAWTRAGHFVGNGPFVLAEWRPHQRIVVKRNPHYAGPDQPSVDELHFLVFDNDDTEERAYRSGQIDVTLTVPRTKLATYSRERPAELQRVELAETRYLSFNTRRPPLNNPQVRLALSAAIDREQLTSRVLLGTQRPATRLLAPALFFNSATSPHTDSPSSPHRHDPQLARELLARAGFPNGDNFPPLELTAWSPSQVTTLEAIQAMWRDTLGIEVTLATREAKVHLESLSAGDYDIAFITQIPSVADPAAVLSEYVTGRSTNYPHWSEADFDSSISELHAIAEPAVLAQRELAAEDLLLRDAPLAPLYYNTRHFLVSPRISGWREDALWQRDYTSVRLNN